MEARRVSRLFADAVGRGRGDDVPATAGERLPPGKHACAGTPGTYSYIVEGLPNWTLRSFSPPHVGHLHASGGTGTASITVSTFVLRSSAAARRFLSVSAGSFFGASGGGIFGRLRRSL